MNKIYTLIIYIILFKTIAFGQIFVSTDGNDSNTGTIDQPLKTITSAINKVQAGDTIYVRGGVYQLTSTITITKSGTAENKYYLCGYKYERPLLDFSQQALGLRGVSLKGSYWHIRGIDIKGAGDNGMEISGASNNTVEFCSFLENRDSGLQLGDGASDNRVINCDSYFNADPPDYGDADGFAPKLTVGSGNYFYGCRAWQNVDDGWDGYLRGANDVSTTLENCWVFRNGYLKDGSNPGAQANGNGFKMGGSDAKDLMHNFIIYNGLAFDNKSKGFDQNSNKGSMTIYNGSAYNNGGNNYSLSTALAGGKTATIINSAAAGLSGSIGSFVVQQTNSWMSPFVVTNDDFISLDTSGVTGARNSDGSLPEINYLHLSETSDLINSGTDVGLLFEGSAPDIGAFEYSAVAAAEPLSKNILTEFALEQNYPNPFNPISNFGFRIAKLGHVEIKVYDIIGREVAVLLNEEKAAGEYTIIFDASGLASAIYYYTMSAGEFSSTKKMVVLK